MQQAYLHKSGPKTHHASSLFRKYTPEKSQLNGFTYINRLYNVSRPNFQSRNHAQNTLYSRFHVKKWSQNLIMQKCGVGLQRLLTDHKEVFCSDELTLSKRRKHLSQMLNDTETIACFQQVCAHNLVNLLMITFLTLDSFHTAG